jgi:hypothetical protein
MSRWYQASLTSAEAVAWKARVLTLPKWDNKIGKQPVQGKKELKKRLHSAIHSLQKNTRRIISFFHLPDTCYAAENVS